MTLAELFIVLSEPYRNSVVFRLDSYRQRQENRQKLRKIIDDLWLDDPDEFLLELAGRDPDQLIALGKKLEELQPAAPGRPAGTTSHTPDEQIRIAAEAIELHERGRRNWKNSICEKYGISQRTLYRYLNFARSESD